MFNRHELNAPKQRARLKRVVKKPIKRKVIAIITAPKTRSRLKKLLIALAIIAALTAASFLYFGVPVVFAAIQTAATYSVNLLGLLKTAIVPTTLAEAGKLAGILFVSAFVTGILINIGEYIAEKIKYRGKSTNEVHLIQQQAQVHARLKRENSEEYAAYFAPKDPAAKEEDRYERKTNAVNGIATGSAGSTALKDLDWEESDSDLGDAPRQKRCP